MCEDREQPAGACNSAGADDRGILVVEPESTCWTIIQAAAAGSDGERAEFARRYGPIVRAYLAARWRDSPCRDELDDAVQEVFLECFKQGGVLERVEPGRGPFRPFLFGVVRHVALRAEHARGQRRQRQPAGDQELEDFAADDPSPSGAFDRAWARELFREAGRLQEQRARTRGPEACRRVELLHLRFQEGLSIREIARRWEIEAAALHHEYARARQEFKAALLEVVAFHHSGPAAEIEQECVDLLAVLK
jgi:RNA polymerase sigma-70 factor (ECF subfamily)